METLKPNPYQQPKKLVKKSGRLRKSKDEDTNNSISQHNICARPEFQVSNAGAWQSELWGRQTARNPKDLSLQRPVPRFAWLNGNASPVHHDDWEGYPESQVALADQGATHQRILIPAYLDTSVS